MEKADYEYIGDGVYASFDGYQFILQTYRASGNHCIALEPEVLNAFLAYIAKVRRERANDD